MSRTSNRNHGSRRDDAERSVVVTPQDLFQCNLGRQVTHCCVFFVETDLDIQYTMKPSLSFFDRERSGHASYHAFDLQNNFGILVR